MSENNCVREVAVALMTHENESLYLCGLHIIPTLDDISYCINVMNIYIIVVSTH